MIKIKIKKEPNILHPLIVSPASKVVLKAFYNKSPPKTPNKQTISRPSTSLPPEFHLPSSLPITIWPIHLSQMVFLCCREANNPTSNHTPLESITTDFKTEEYLAPASSPT